MDHLNSIRAALRASAPVVAVPVKDHRPLCFIMNPPFGRNSAPSHILKAMCFLKPGGRLVAVMPSSVTFRTDRLNKMVRAAVDVGGSIEPLPENSFAESGTNVNTVIVTINALFDRRPN